ncbi:MAG: YtxH domain-containing protein [Pedobacter sp.]|nr:YtxH domain-containing protein [Pedobacter sp.]MDQ8051711.1 YtxH domain-containing protein [Pedobacter sp.]
MGILRAALIGAAVYGAYKYLTKKDELTGRSIADDIQDQAPQWVEKIKGYKDELTTRMNAPMGRYTE